MNSVSLRHFGIVVEDLDRALAFYRDLLGFIEARRMEESGPFIERLLALPGARLTTAKLEAGSGGVQIELLQFHHPSGAAAAPRAVTDRGPTHLALTVEDIDALYDRLAATGRPFLSPPLLSDDGRAKVAFCRDPDGTLLELVELVAG